MGNTHSSRKDFSSYGEGAYPQNFGTTARRSLNLSRHGYDPKVQRCLEEELASRAMILSEYELEAERISNRHPLSPQSIATYTSETHLVFIRYGKAYDATSWYEIHPGGKFVLQKYAGQDVTEIFERMHSRKTKQLVEEVCIGKVWCGREHRNPTSPSLHAAFSPTARTPGINIGKNEFLLRSPIGSDHGDYEGRIVRVKPLTPSGHIIRIYIAFPERLQCELGGSIVIKNRGVARNYSPCYIEETNFSLVIKRYPKGNVSGFLFSKKVGDCLEFDGPYAPKTLIPDQKFKTLLLIGQGTGVVPILEVARTVVAETIFFVSCYSEVSDVIFSKELSLLPSNIRLIYFIPGADAQTDSDKVPGLLFNCRINPENLAAAMAVPNNSFSSSPRKSTNPSPHSESHSSVTSIPSPSKRAPSEIDRVVICGSFTFFDDVKKGLVEKLNIRKDSIIQL